MKIEAVNVAFPSRVVTNDDILSLIRWHSSHVLRGSMEEVLAKIGSTLTVSGSGTRRWLAPGETPIQFIRQAITGALEAAGVGPRDVDLLIYVGVGKGFLEPGQSYLVAHSMGMAGVECFDLLDACMSWTRAMQISETLLRTGRYKRILVVNGEFNLREGGPGYPQNFKLSTVDQLEWTFPTYTIGEAATATLLTSDEGNDWTWAFESAPELADLCTIPGPGFEMYCDMNEKIGRNGDLRFTSFGTDLHRAASAPARRLLQEVLEKSGPVERIFPHASSKRAWDRYGESIGVAAKLFHVYPEYGNLVSASVPAGIALAASGGLIERGQRIAGWVGSAGMSFAAYSFRF